MALGGIRLEQGDFSAARGAGNGSCPSKFRRVRSTPGPVIPIMLHPAAVRASLVLASILEGSPHCGPGTNFRVGPPPWRCTRGRLGGREVRYAAALAELLSQNRLWPKAGPGADWPTFAGSPARNTIAPELIDVAGVQWRARLREPPRCRSPWNCCGRPWPIIPSRRWHFIPRSARGACSSPIKPRFSDSAAIPASRPGARGGASIYREPADAPLAMPGPGDALGTPRTP